MTWLRTTNVPSLRSAFRLGSAATGTIVQRQLALISGSAVHRPHRLAGVRRLSVVPNGTTGTVQGARQLTSAIVYTLLGTTYGPAGNNVARPAGHLCPRLDKQRTPALTTKQSTVANLALAGTLTRAATAASCRAKPSRSTATTSPDRTAATGHHLRQRQPRRWRVRPGGRYQEVQCKHGYSFTGITIGDVIWHNHRLPTNPAQPTLLYCQ